MRRWGIVSLIGLSVFVTPIVTAAPAHAVCFSFFQQCQSPPTTTAPPVTTPPVTTPPVTTPPVAAPPAPSAVDPNQAAAEFFDDTNAARATAGLAPYGWRADVASMAVSHSVEMAQQGSIWHGSFVSESTLHSLNAASIGENVGMGQGVQQIQDAFMASPHHYENIMDPAFNQVGVGVIVSGGTIYVTLDFVQAKGGPVSARPTPVSHPVVHRAAPPHTTNSVAAAPPRVATTVAPTTTTTAPPAPPTTGVVTPLPVNPAPAQAVSSPGTLVTSGDPGAAGWSVMFGVLLLMAIGGHVVVRRRRRA